jgi:hypothetical protein
MKFKGAKGGVATCCPAARLPVNRDSGEGEDDTATDRSAKDAGRGEDAHQELIDDLTMNRWILRPGDDVVVVDAALGVHIGLDDDD